MFQAASEYFATLCDRFGQGWNQFWYTADMIYMGMGQKYVIYINWRYRPGLHIRNRVFALG